MWIRTVNLPAELVEAHRAGTLVLFVGAGASRDAPSSLPLFGTLTADIAAEVQIYQRPTTTSRIRMCSWASFKISKSMCIVLWLPASGCRPRSQIGCTGHWEN